MVGLCPFHTEKTPSFHVNEREQFFYCFGCKTGGDVITFQALIKGYDNVDALKDLAKEYGIELSKGYSKESSALRNKIKKMEEQNKEARDFFCSEYENIYNDIVVNNVNDPNTNKPKENEYLNYLNERGINEETRKLFNIGVDTGNGLSKYLLKKHEDVKEYEELGLIIKSSKTSHYFDRFNERIVFPIINYRGETVGFSARLIKERKDVGKYINSKDSELFHKRENLFALNLTRDSIIKEESAIVVEGQIDVISLFQAGIKNVTAGLGTALTKEAAVLLKKWTDKVILCYDNDTAGEKALLSAGELLKENGLKVDVISFSNSKLIGEENDAPKDPDEYLKKYGAEKFKEEIKNAISFLDFKILLIKRECSIKNESKEEYVSKVLELLADNNKRVVVGQKIKEIADDTGIREDDIRSDFEKLINSPKYSVKKENEKIIKNSKSALDETWAKTEDIKNEEKLITELFSILTLKDYKLSEEINLDEISSFNEKQIAYLGKLKNITSESEIEKEKIEVENKIKKGKVFVFKDYKKQFNEILSQLKKIKLKKERQRIYQELATIDEAKDIKEVEKEEHRKECLVKIDSLTKIISKI